MSQLSGLGFDARRSNYVYDPFSGHGGGHYGYDDHHFNDYHHSDLATSYVDLPYAPPHHAAGVADGMIDWKETPEAYILKTYLPGGVRKADVTVVVEDDRVLKISGERVDDRLSTNHNWDHVERSRGKFLTALRLPQDARADLIRSSMENNGLLTVRIPKNHHPRHHVRPVEITDSDLLGQF